MERKARIEYRTSSERKQRLLDYANVRVRPLNDVIDEATDKLLEANGNQDPTETEARHLEDRLRDVESRLVRVEGVKNAAGMKDDRAYYFAAFLMEAPYVGLKGNWQAIRFQALEDFRKGSADWVPQWGVKNESQIIEVCRLASDIVGLRAERDELKQRLNAIYKSLSQPATVTQPSREEEAKSEAA